MAYAIEYAVRYKPVTGQTIRKAKNMVGIITRALLYVLVFFLGASIGSFGLVIIRRGHNNDWSSWLTGKSYCESCKKTLEWWELLPFISYLCLGGKCSKCKSKINPSHFICETGCGIIYVVSFLLYRMHSLSVIGAILAVLINTVMWLLSMSDFLYREISVIPVYIVGLVMAIFNSFQTKTLYNILIVVALFALSAIIGRNDNFASFGGGDIDVLIFLYAITLTPIAILNIILYAAFIGIILYLVYYKHQEDFSIPFVPCMYAAYLINICGFNFTELLYSLLRTYIFK